MIKDVSTVSGVYLAFDYGISWTGVAVGQTVTGTSTPLAPLRMKQGKTDATQLNALVAEWQPSGFVLGLPDAPNRPTGNNANNSNNINNNETNIARRVRSFADYLVRHYGCACHFIDERLTSRSLADARSIKESSASLPADKASADSRVAQALLCQWMRQEFPPTDEPHT